LEVIIIDYSFLKENSEIKKLKILITGVAGFIGSNLLEFLLKEGFRIVGIDNFSTGSKENIDDSIKKSSKSNKTSNFSFIEGDIRKYSDCVKAVEKVDVVFHQAALGSVQRSLDNPVEANDVNVSGTINLLKASVDNNIKKFIFASSSSIYGDSEILPKEENMAPNPKSIYAATKMASEYYVRLFFKIYGLKTISLRYFNVFGNRQNPDSIYSAVIPIFLKNIKLNQEIKVFGDGNQNRDFTYIDNVIYANMLALFSENNIISGNFYNVGCGRKISLNEIIKFLEKRLNKKIYVSYQMERKGDVKSSLASIIKIKSDLGYEPIMGFYDGIKDLIKLNSLL
jgi:UDP-N-acetylglucosamine 4-epimerase